MAEPCASVNPRKIIDAEVLEHQMVSSRGFVSLLEGHDPVRNPILMQLNGWYCIA